MIVPRINGSSSPARRRAARLAAALLLSVLGAAASADGLPDRMDTARQLVAVLDYKELFEAYLAQCQGGDSTVFDAAAAYRRDPAAFGGISPQSAYWPEVEAAYQRYRERACGYLSAQEFSDFLARQFADRMSLDDMRASLAFYATPAGRRVLKAGVDANAAWQAHSQKVADRVITEATGAVVQELGEIAARYRQAPR